jgi:outer membrane protein
MRLTLTLHGLLWCCTVVLPVQAQDSAPDLVTLYQGATLESPGLAGAQALTRAAEQDTRAARGQLLPQVAAIGEASHVDERIQGDFFGLANVNRDANFERYLYGVVLEQPVLQPSLWADLDRSRLQQIQAEQFETRARNRLLSSVIEGYFEVLQTIAVAAAADARVDSVDEQLKQVTSRVDAGLLTNADRAQAESAAALASVQASVAQSDVVVAIKRLRATTRWNSNRLKGLSDTFSYVMPNPLEETFWVDQAAAKAPQVLEQQLEVALAEGELQRTRRSRWPTVDLFGSATELDSGGGLEGRRDQRDLRIGARARIPLFSGGSVTAAVAGRSEQLEQARQELERLQLDARLEAANRYRQVVVGRSQLIALRQAADAARQAEAEFRTGFDVGTRTSADLLTATDRRFAAEVAFQQRRYQQLLDGIALKDAAGLLSPHDLLQMNELLTTPVVMPF